MEIYLDTHGDKDYIRAASRVLARVVQFTSYTLYYPNDNCISVDVAESITNRELYNQRTNDKPDLIRIHNRHSPESLLVITTCPETLLNRSTSYHTTMGDIAIVGSAVYSAKEYRGNFPCAKLKYLQAKDENRLEILVHRYLMGNLFC